METDEESARAAAKSNILAAARATGKPRLSIWSVTRKAGSVFRESDVNEWLGSDSAFQKAFQAELRVGQINRMKCRQPTGRPRSLTPASHVAIIEEIRNGASVAAILSKWKICKATFYNERRNFPQFDEAIRTAMIERDEMKNSDEWS